MKNTYNDLAEVLSRVGFSVEIYGGNTLETFEVANLLRRLFDNKDIEDIERSVFIYHDIALENVVYKQHKRIEELENRLALA